jgi:hypothetical protein
MKHRVHEEGGLGNAEDLLHQDEVPRTAHRKELGEALDDAEDDRGEDIHIDS